MNHAKKAVVAIIVVAVSVFVLFVLQCLVVPKYMSGVLEGGLVREYYDETTDHDVVFVGDCEVYENFSPITLWENYGITSYIRGSAQQLIWQSYYLLEETFEYETPDVVVFNVLSMKYDEPQSEAYNRMTLDGMKLSGVKMDAVNASMTDEEEAVTYIFPLLRFHSRITELEEDDLTYIFSRKKISNNGYLMRVDTEPMTQLPYPEQLGDYTFSDICWDYLDKMRELCEENDSELILVKSPSLYPAWYDEWDEQIAAYAEKNHLLYINYADSYEDIGIDMNTDTYDGGLHLNLYGAEKLSDAFGKVLSEEYGVEDHRGEEPYESVYAEKVQFYYDEEHSQLEELEKYGYLKSWTLGDQETDS